MRMSEMSGCLKPLMHTKTLLRVTLGENQAEMPKMGHGGGQHLDTSYIPLDRLGSW